MTTTTVTERMKNGVCSSSSHGIESGIDDLQQKQEKETSNDFDQDCDRVKKARKRPRSPPLQENEGSEKRDLGHRRSKRHRT